MVPSSISRASGNRSLCCTASFRDSYVMALCWYISATTLNTGRFGSSCTLYKLVNDLALTQIWCYWYDQDLGFPSKWPCIGESNVLGSNSIRCTSFHGNGSISVKTLACSLTSGLCNSIKTIIQMRKNYLHPRIAGVCMLFKLRWSGRGFNKVSLFYRSPTTSLERQFTVNGGRYAGC